VVGVAQLTVREAQPAVGLEGMAAGWKTEVVAEGQMTMRRAERKPFH
jgi:hypothetical protein